MENSDFFIQPNHPVTAGALEEKKEIKLNSKNIEISKTEIQ